MLVCLRVLARLRDVNFPPVALRLHLVIRYASSAKRDYLVHDSLGRNTPNNLLKPSGNCP